MVRRRTLLRALAVSPLAAVPTATATAHRLGVAWRTAVGDTELLDSARVDGETLLLVRPEGDPATIHAVDDRGDRTWSRRLDAVPDARAIAGAGDGGFLVVGPGDDEASPVVRFGSDRSPSWRHRIERGHHDDEFRVRPLDDGVALVSNSIGTHAVSTRVQHVAADGTVQWVHTRDGLAGLVTGGIDGDLAVGGYAFESEFHGWLDRLAPDGGTVWSRRWPEYLDAASAGPGGGIAVANLPEDEGGPGWRLRYLSTDGETQRAWVHHFDGDAPAPTATRRLADGGALTVAEVDEPGRVFLLRTGPDGSPDPTTVVPGDGPTVPRAVYPLDDGAVVAGHAQSATEPGSWVARLSPGASRRETTSATPTETATRTRTATDTEVTPYPPPPTAVTETTTGDSGPGFGAGTTLLALAVGWLARRAGDRENGE
ncbi:hypothetical protein [Haloarcula litorea]|uniref:hypothetical protein n=1 Tax=Haloarcula litorea TaxID=3032579 RepID=UPI0023E7F3B4|nr:hypothetical protein [Halomicroarcula sp. GDY20]